MLRTLHRWIGLVAGLWVVALGISGSALVYRDGLEAREARQFSSVTPAGSALDLDRLAGIANAERTDKRIVRVRLPQADAPDRAVEFIMLTRGARTLKEAQLVSVYVDPYRGVSLGQRDHTTSWIWWMQDFHYALLAGERGLRINGLAALMLIALGITGLLTWWPGLRWAMIRNTLRVRVSSPAIVWLRDLHILTGLISLLLLLLIAVTAMYYTFRPTVTAAVERVTGERLPSPAVEMLADAPYATLEAIVAAARTEVADARLLELRPSSRAGVAATLNFVLPGEHVPAGNRIYVHPQSAEVLRVDYHQSLPTTDWLFASMAPWHFGHFGGQVTRAIWFVVGLAPLGLLGSGGFVWLRRRQRKRQSPGARSAAA